MRVRLRHNTKQKRLLRVVFLSLVVIGIGLLLPKVISVAVSVVTYPVHVTNIWLKESSSLVPTFFRDRQSLQERIEELENELIVANKTDLTQRRLSEENNRLRGLLGVNEETRTAAAIIARPDELPFDLLQIDRGTKHGIEVGAPVFIGKDIVIGLVVHTASEYSFVELVTTAGFEATAFISGPNVVVTMEGIGGGVARVKVPQGVSLSIGNLVYLPSVEPGVFGQISFIENEPTQPEQYGYISPDIAVSGLHRVSVGSLSQISRSADEIDERILDKMKNELKVSDVSVGTTSSTTQDIF